jgi:hypothetical protein
MKIQSGVLPVVAFLCWEGRVLSVDTFKQSHSSSIMQEGLGDELSNFTKIKIYWAPQTI